MNVGIVPGRTKFRRRRRPGHGCQGFGSLRRRPGRGFLGRKGEGRPRGVLRFLESGDAAEGGCCEGEEAQRGEEGSRGLGGVVSGVRRGELG